MRSRFTSVVAVGAMVTAGMVVSAASASAALSPVVDRSSATVTADALPTVQIDGVVWAQTIVGDTVYAVGSFANARPAGAAPGTQLVARSNILSYNLTTGVLNTGFTASLNQQAYAITAAPDGSRIYVAGMFTQVNGVARSRIAALNPTTGALITGFNAGADFTVRSLVATSATVYVGGAFTGAKGSARNRLAAYTAATGALTAWAPSADAVVNTMVMSPDGKLIVGGAFATVNGSAAVGLARLDPTNGALLPWNATAIVHNSGTSAAITSLKTDGTAIYGTGYVFGPGGNLEGTFSAEPATGDINWVEDCHGDTYDNFASAGAVYTVSHAHYCGNIGGFPQSDPWATNMRHALAFTKTATGAIGHDPFGYWDFANQNVQSPSLTTWFPDLDTGTYTGKTQAAWSVTGNNQYVVLGGEFPKVNNMGQQGLVRFAVKPTAPAKIAPSLSGSNFVPGIIGLSSGAARVAWSANSDRDNKTLTYKLIRDNVVIDQVDADSTFWNRPTMGYIDDTVVPGVTYKYRVSATDVDGNVALGNIVSFTAPAAGGSNPYATRVAADGASPYWPMNEASGTVLYDNVGFNDADTGAGVTRSVAGAVSGDAATTFDGATSASTRTAIAGPNTFTAQAWIKTTTTSGGKILGFGGSSSGNSGSYDRHIYMDNTGHIFFGVYPNGVATLNSTGTYNDGQWHQISASLGPDGMKLYIDDKLIGQRADVTWGQEYSGFWRVGGDNIGGWPNQPSSNTFAGTIDEVAIYPTVLSRQAIDAQWVASGRASNIAAAPSDKYGAAVFNDSPLLYWRLGESTGTNAADAGPNGDQTGTYQNGVTLGAVGGIKGTTDKAASFDGADDFVTSKNVYSNPSNYSLEAWFKTTSTQAGKIIGFGNNPDGLSSSYDRHVYLDGSGKVSFGTWTGQTNLITSSNSYNDGSWHHVVATQSSSTGMKMYLDGSLVGSNGQTSAQDYSGYWKVGGDNQWAGGSPYLQSTIDDVAVYGSVLSPTEVSNHYNLGNTAPAANVAPTAAFTNTTQGLTATFDGSTSSDSDGTIAGYAWNFGDGQTGTGRTPTNTYAAAGSYTVTLTVTDNVGATDVASRQVSVTAPPPANVAPTASFTATPAGLRANVDATGSSDPDGTIDAYSWSFGDGGTGTGETAFHDYANAGTYSVKLTVTDNDGASGTYTKSVTVTAPPVNQPPVSSFNVTVNGLTADLKSTSTDPDGTIAGFAWDFGDGATSTDAATVHTYATGGDHTITLVVTDNGGATATSRQTKTFTAPVANVAPTARFAWTTSGLTANFDGRTSTDSDGTIAGYSWNFGDGATDVSNSSTVNHSYTTAGTYPVALTVTDDKGGANTVNHDVIVSVPAVTPLISDTFNRTVTNGLGTADVGGAWAVTGSTSNYSVSAGTGKVKMAAAGSGPTASLGAVGSADVNATIDMALDKAGSGSGTFMSVAVRKVGNSQYRTTAKFLGGGSVQLQLVKIVSGASTTLSTVTVPGLSYVAGTVVTVRFQVSGSASVSLNAKLWKTGTTEPATWQTSVIDSSATLSAAGGVALYPYLSVSSTLGAVVATYDNLKVVPVNP